MKKPKYSKSISANENDSEQGYSAAHAEFLKREKKKTFSVHFARIALLLFLLALWEGAAALNIIDPFLASSPSRIAKTIFSLSGEGKLFYHAAVTLLETLAGFTLSFFLGLLFALIFWWSPSLNKIFEPYLVVLNALPKIALGPLLIIWFGTGQKAILAMTILVCVIIATMNLLAAFLSVSEGKITLLKSMGATKKQILFYLVLPASSSAFLSALKINVGMAWIGAVMGEYIVSKAGLGYLIVYGGQVFKLDLVMASITLLCVMATAMYAVIAFFEQRGRTDGKKE